MIEFSSKNVLKQFLALGVIKTNRSLNLN